MTYRQLSYKQLQKQLDEMREEKEAAVQRALELKRELERQRNGSSVEMNETKSRTKVSIRATDNSTVSDVRVGTEFGPKIAHNPKRWMKIGAWVILAMIGLPVLFGGVYAIAGYTYTVSFLIVFALIFIACAISVLFSEENRHWK